jgi:hypothetical protein
VSLNTGSAGHATARNQGISFQLVLVLLVGVRMSLRGTIAERRGRDDHGGPDRVIPSYLVV